MPQTRVLVLITALNRAGAETHVMNYYRQIRRDFEAGIGPDIQYDFLVNRDEIGDYEAEILELGGRIFRMSPMYPWTFYRYRREFTAFLNAHHEYQIIHSHLEERSYFPMQIAANLGIPVRIVHAHNYYPFGKFHDLKWYFRQYFRRGLRQGSRRGVGANKLFYVSQRAGSWLFGEELMDNGACVYMPNAVDLERFLGNKNKNCGDINLLMLGRLEHQKNHRFALQVLAQYIARYPNSQIRLQIVGDGSLKPELTELMGRLGLSDIVEFVGNVSNPEDYLSSADILLLPSLYEGLGMVAIEAQLARTRVIASENVPSEAAISDEITYLPLDLETWVQKIAKINHRHEFALNDEKLRNFDIRIQVKRLLAEYGV